MRRRQMYWLPLDNTGSRLGPFYQRSHKIDMSQATTSFILLPFQPNQRGHAYIITNLYPTQSPQDWPRQLLPISLPYLCLCQNLRHSQPLQVIIHHQKCLLTPWRHSSRWCTRRIIKCHNYVAYANTNFSSVNPTNTDRSAIQTTASPLSKMGRDSIDNPSIPCTSCDVQGRRVLLQSPRLDANKTIKQAPQRRDQSWHAGVATLISLFNISQQHQIRVRQDLRAFSFVNSS